MSAQHRSHRVLFVSTVNPAARDVGKKVVVHGLCRFLREEYGQTNFLFACTERGDDFEGEYVALPRPGAFEKFCSVVWWSFVTRRRPIQEALFRGRALRRRIEQVVQEFAPDLVVFDTVRMGQYLDLPSARVRKVLYLDDLFSVRYDRMLSADADGVAPLANPLGNFRAHVPAPFRWVLDRSTGLLRWMLRLERDLVRDAELRQSPRTDVALLVNPQEVQLYVQRGAVCTVCECPPYLGEIHSPARDWQGRPDFVFLGSLNLPHNAVAIEQFVSRVFPVLLERLPDATLTIVGKHAPASLLELATPFGDRIRIEGFVRNLGDVLARHAALVAPLVFGSGVKIKVIEALAAGLPVVSTPIGAEGVRLQDGVHGRIVERLADFPDALLAVSDLDLNRRMSAACRRLYDDVYSWEPVQRAYRAALGTSTLHPSEDL